MRVIPASVRVIQEKSPTKKIERIARICYKSEDKICEGSDIKMVQSLLKRRHMAMVEHASVCLTMDEETYYHVWRVMRAAEEQVLEGVEPWKCYLRFTELLNLEGTTPDAEHPYRARIEACNQVERFCISGNLRAWYESLEKMEEVNAIPPKMIVPLVEAAGGENGVLSRWYKYDVPVDEAHNYRDYGPEDYDVFCEAIEPSTLTNEERMMHEDISVLFTIDRGVTHELVRMRDCSFAQESTRYCNYNMGKYDSEITVIKPCFYEEGTDLYNEWYNGCLNDEGTYMQMISLGALPQQARDNLPHSTKAEIVATTNLREWRHILSLRACDSTGPAHPQIREVMCPLLKELRPQYPFAFGNLIMPEEK